MKETFFFSHDYNARTDAKLQRIQMRHGMEGIGIFWCIIEMLYEEGGYISINEYERITFELRTNYDIVKSVIEDFSLFIINDDLFHSNSVIERIEKRMEKSKKAQESINKRWEKRKNTNVLQTNYDSNTIKERKGKEKKEKENKEDDNKENIYRSFSHLKLFESEYKTLLETYSKKDIDRILDAIENFKQNTKYKSLFLTAKNWLENDKQKNLEKNGTKNQNFGVDARIERGGLFGKL